MNMLSKSQKIVYDMEKYIGGASAVICGSLLAEGEKDPGELKKAANELFRINSALRTRITIVGTQAMQFADDYKEEEIEVLYFKDHDSLDVYANQYAQSAIDIHGTLCEMKIIFVAGSYGLLIKMHHLIGDAWTLALLASQFHAILEGDLPKSFPYSAHLANEQAYLHSGRYSRDRAFFVEEYKRCNEVAYLSNKHSNSFAAKRMSFVLDKNEVLLIKKFAETENCSVFVLFMAALAFYISRIKQNTEKFYIGTDVLNRAGFREKNTAGMFVNTIPVLAEIDNGKPAAENLMMVKDAVFAALRHQRFNYGDVLAAIRQEFGFKERLYDVTLSYQNAVINSPKTNMKSAWYHNGVQTESLQIHIDDRDREGLLRIYFDYQVEKFTQKEIEVMYGHILRLLFDTIKNKHKKIYELQMLSEEEQRLLSKFNDTFAAYPKGKGIHQIFEEQAESIPDQVAVVACDKQLTYSELNREANRIAHALLEKGIGCGDIVAFALPRESCLLSTIIGILKSGAAYLPVSKDYPEERIVFMLSDSNAKLFITEDNIAGLMQDKNTDNPCLDIDEESLCYCIYTSGSTGNPKCTAIRHRNIRNTLLWRKENYNWCRQYILSISDVTTDTFTEDIWSAVLSGNVLVLVEQNRSMSEINGAIKKYPDASMMTTPTFFKSILGASPKQTVKEAVLVGEKLDEALAKDIIERGIMLHNEYGPSEAAVCASYARIDGVSESNGEGISIGRPIANVQIYIVDRYLQPVPIGVTGELCIAGAGVGIGYLNQPEQTVERFVNNPFGEGILYKTGDLAAWQKDGSIVYVGRNDFQVKVRGLRIELGEIETALHAIDGILQSAVVIHTETDNRQLICAYYTGKEQEVKTLRSALSQKLPQYMLPHSYIRIEKMPLTTSGKINRRALQAIKPRIAAAEEYIAPVTEKEIAAANAAQKALRLSQVGMMDNFFSMGGDSLKAIEWIDLLEQAGYITDIKTIFETDTIGELAKHLTNKGARQEQPSRNGQDVFPASAAQLRVYTAQAIAGGTTYNVPSSFRVKSLDPEKLQKAVSMLIERHDILRTRFEARSGQVVQIIENSAACAVERLDSEDISAFIRPFALDTAPLLRVGYFQNTIMIDMHHIITDGGAMPILLHELNELYMGRKLTLEPVQYWEYAVQKKDLTESEAYWLSVFADEPPTLEMNTDYPRKNSQTFSGAVLYDEIPRPIHEKICSLCAEMSMTPYVFYSSAFLILLSKFSGNEDLTVGIPISGRNGKYLSSLGMFTNTLALRGRPEGKKTITEFLREMKVAVMEALVHQDYPYGELIKKLGIHTENRNPLFDVMFAYQSEAMLDVVFGDQPAELLPIPITASKYDFSFNLLPGKEGVVFMSEYCTDLYAERTVRRLMDGYKMLLTQMLDRKGCLSELDVITEDEKQKLLYAFNDTAAAYPKDKCVHQLFEEQAKKTPDKIAVIACDKTLTYKELNEEANRIANGLIEKGVKKGDIVAFSLPRKSCLISAMFGILKVGAAYLPLDMDFPYARVEYMLEDCGAKLLVDSDTVEMLLANSKTDVPTVPVSSNDLCYCIYTSGTTGNPKGILIRHNSVVNFVQNNYKNMFQKRLLSDCDYIISVNTISFDIVLQEIHLPLLNGYTTIFLSDSQLYNIETACNLFEGKNCGLIITPTKLNLYMKNRTFCNSMRYIKVIMCGAETFPSNMLCKIRAYTNATIINGYGPTETTCGVLYSEIHSEGNITIGCPVANTQAYIVNHYMQPTPIGVIGELCIAGDGVGAGYLNRPELTAEKFIDNPFGEGKLYKTGDLAYWREDGRITYVGRNDFQVKIRGLRIELGEIESALHEIGGVTQAVVVIRKNAEGRQIICAFYTGEKTDGKTLRTLLSQRLPKYMLPHIFTYLAAMPLTTSGKIDRKALPEVDLSQIVSSADYAAPIGDLEVRLADIMGQVLKYSPVGRNDDFFDLGGDSLKAIEFVSKAHNDGIYFALQRIFDCPTVRQLAEHIQSVDRSNLSFTDEDFSNADKILEKNNTECISMPRKTNVGNILLTGATGYLGIHILAEFIEQEKGTAYCIVRENEHMSAAQRLKHLLQFYFGGKYASCDRIIVISADLQKDYFGLSKTEYDSLLTQIDTVINTAASVKHYGSYQYFYEANVETVKRLTKFCMSGRARLLHISTLSVSGDSFVSVENDLGKQKKYFSECCLYIGQQLDNVYVRSKFEAEKIVLDAMANGLDANILRVGNLTNRLSDGMFQKNYESNAFLKRLKAILELGAIPQYFAALLVEFTPVDEASKAIMLIAQHFNNEQTVFHINNTKVLTFDTIITYMNDLGYSVRFISDNEFASKLRKTIDNKETKHIFEAFINNMDSNDHINYTTDIQADSSFTVQYLTQLGFDWPELDIMYFQRYIKYFENIGFFTINDLEG